MRSLSYLALLLCVAACQNPPKNEPVDYEQIADAITTRVAQKIKKETHLVLSGTGGGMMNHIQRVSMAFDCYEEISMDKARELLIYCVDEYRSAINASEKVRPYLIRYPFTLRGIGIQIFICKKDRHDVPIGSLSVVTAIDGLLTYKERTPGIPSFKRMHRETYEEAVEILKKQKDLGIPQATPPI